MAEKIRVNIVGVANLPLSALNAFQEDIKILTDENYEKLKEDILKDGFSFSPHVFFDSEGKAWLLDGHQRRSCLERMEAEGYEIPIIPCMEVEAESLEHARRLVFGGISQYGTFQVKKLTEFAAKTGITGEEMLKRFTVPMVKFEKLVNVAGYVRGSGEEITAPPPAQPVTKRGDIWILGKHRLMCGSATDFEDMAKLLGDTQAEITFTSPPYNANTKLLRVRKDGSRTNNPLYTHSPDDMDPDEYVEFAKAALDSAIDNTLRWVFWNVNYNANCRFAFLSQLSFHLPRLHETICWHKRVATALKFGLTRRWEPIFVFRCDKAEEDLAKGGDEQNYWDITTGDQNTEIHRAAFPVALPEKALTLTNAKTVLDPFGGTGSTLIAAEKLNRVCYMMEISPAYVDAIVGRWEKFTGQKARRGD